MKINWEESPTLNTCHQTRYAPLQNWRLSQCLGCELRIHPIIQLSSCQDSHLSADRCLEEWATSKMSQICVYYPWAKKNGFPSSSQDQGLFFHFLWAVVMGNHAESQNHKLDQAGREWSGSFQPISQVKHGLPRVHCTGLWLGASWASSVSDTPQPLWSVPVLHHLHGKDVLPNSLSIHFKHDLCAFKYTFRTEPRKKHNLF